jgi:hypothetical protein
MDSKISVISILDNSAYILYNLHRIEMLFYRKWLFIIPEINLTVCGFFAGKNNFYYKKV